MRLEDYWGVGPKTAELLDAELGADAAIDAIESANSRALMAAGLSRGRATRILRRAHGGERMAILATGDTRAVYKNLLALAEEYAVTRHAADRIRVLTPLSTPEAMEERLDAVMLAVDTWRGLDETTRERVLDAFGAYDSVEGGERAAVETALALRDAGVSDGVFASLGDLDTEALRDAADALGHLDGDTVEAGADQQLDRLRTRLDAVERLESGALDVLESIRADGARDLDAFRAAFVRYVASEADVPADRIRETMPDDAADAADFVGGALRALSADLRKAVDDREAAVAADLREAIDAAGDDVDAAITAVDDIAFHVSLARFAIAFDLTRPEFVTDRDTLAVVGARNLFLAAGNTPVQSVTYAVGDHGLANSDGPPTGDRVAVLTGANSGGKTTLLETLCQVSLLAQIGLPVPADQAEVSVVDAVVFHRRHASFNAGVLESTLRTIVPPLTGSGRTLMLVDEFEAITEPGSAADLLHGLVTLTVDRDALGVFVTHLADDLKPLPDAARTDGIFAEGLDAALELEVDYQPRFHTIGKSTPEFIVSRLIADADDRVARAGYETLAEALGEAVVQRTLADARWAR